MRLLFSAAALVALLAVSGCAQGGTKSTSSSENYSGDEKLVANTIEDFQANATAQDGAKICSTQITAQLAKQISAKNSGASCATAVTAGMKATDEADLTVTDVTIDPKDDNKATATVSAKTGEKSSQKYSFRLERADKRWQISSFG